MESGLLQRRGPSVRSILFALNSDDSSFCVTTERQSREKFD